MHDTDVLRGVGVRRLRREGEGRWLGRPWRHGKLLIVPVRDGQALVWHFGMTGKLVCARADDPPTAHSMTTRVTCSATSQSLSSSKEFVVVAKVRISCRRDRRPTRAGGADARLEVLLADVRRGTTLVQHVHKPLPVTASPGVPSGGTTGLKSLVRVLPQQLTVPVSSPQRHTERRAHRHHRFVGVPDGHTPIFPASRRPAQPVRVTERKIDLREGRRQHPGRLRTGCRGWDRSGGRGFDGDLVAEGPKRQSVQESDRRAEP
ncbi:DNA-formamidopyrimidine glycosylase family protein [Streptomyces sp. MUSC 14]|uniref:DNA-formamidopyrimidine glycosylase family protein n=1 Tax=Streptomyces sp. MUSC 14 TaxID=1354889 RepID=UPI00210C8B14|nr:DNA-formamidopyrimidine glycosylase family protein [Streptomyces sp. MUSC 14]